MGCWHSAPAWCVHQPFPKPYWLAHACVASLPCLLADPGGAAGAGAEGAVKQENVPRLAAVADHLALAQAMEREWGPMVRGLPLPCCACIERKRASQSRVSLSASPVCVCPHRWRSPTVVRARPKLVKELLSSQTQLLQVQRPAQPTQSLRDWARQWRVR